MGSAPAGGVNRRSPKSRCQMNVVAGAHSGLRLPDTTPSSLTSSPTPVKPVYHRIDVERAATPSQMNGCNVPAVPATYPVSLIAAG